MIKFLGLAILASIPVSSCDPPAAPVDVADARESIPASRSAIVASIERGLTYLGEEGDRWMEGKARVQDGTGCVSCHHVGFTLWSHREAQRAGVQLVDSGIDDLRRRAYAFQTGLSEVVPATQLILAGVYQERDTTSCKCCAAP